MNIARPEPEESKPGQRKRSIRYNSTRRNLHMASIPKPSIAATPVSTGSNSPTFAPTRSLSAAEESPTKLDCEAGCHRPASSIPNSNASPKPAAPCVGSITENRVTAAIIMNKGAGDAVEPAGEAPAPTEEAAPAAPKGGKGKAKPAKAAKGKKKKK